MRQEALDRIDRRRFDSEDTRDRLDRYDDLTDDEQDEYLGHWEFAGLDEAEHVLGSFLGESHNATHVVRDLDGELRLLWEELPEGPWRVGPLFRSHPPDAAEIWDLLAHHEIELKPEIVLAAVESLPPTDQPLRSY